MLREPKVVTYPFGRYWWLEVNPHEYQIRATDPAQTIIGRLVEVPAHGRDKGKWLLPDANQEYPDSQQAVMGLEIWRQLDRATAPAAPAPVVEPEPPPAAPAEPDTSGWLSQREAAQQAGVSDSTINGWILRGKIPGARKVPNPVKANELVWRIPPTFVTPIDARRAAPAPVPPAEPPPVVVEPEIPPTSTPPPKPERAPRAAPPPFDPAPLYQEIGRLQGQVEALTNDVRYLALRVQAQPAPAPSLWQRLAGASTNGHNGG